MIFLLVTAITVLSVFSIERGEKQRDAADVAFMETENWAQLVSLSITVSEEQPAPQ